jgi:acyl carrier protein
MRPGLADIISMLRDITGESDFRTDVAISSLDLDSVEIIELLYRIGESCGIEVENDVTLIRQLEHITLAGLAETVSSLPGESP